MPLGGVDNLFSDALNEFLVANYFRGDHSNVVPVVPAVVRKVVQLRKSYTL